MSSLRGIEKQYFENLLGMGSGYVMDFSNGSFQNFVWDAAGVNIYDEAYEYRGPSKANHLRALWETAPDHIVGKVLDELLDYWELKNVGGSADGAVVQRCRGTVDRLLGRTSEVGQPVSVDALPSEFADVTAEGLKIDPAMIPILTDRIHEADRCMKAGCHLSVVLLSGSVLEGALLGMAVKMPRRFNEARCSPRDREDKVKPFSVWTLNEFINVAHEVGVLRLDVKKFSHELRDFRNYVHPYQQQASHFAPDEHTARICLQVLKAAIAQLSE